MATIPEAELFAEHYRNADESTRQLGEEWYPTARRIARRLAKDHGTTLARAAGVLAAISPRIRWAANVALADDILAGREVRGVFGQNVAKARRILAGEAPLDVLGGDKVRAFYRAIMGDSEAVVLDVWMLRAAGWEKKSITSAEYGAVAYALQQAADAAGIDPSAFQAIIWTQVRGGAE